MRLFDILRRAFADTISQAGGIAGVCLLFSGPVAGLGVQWHDEGKHAVLSGWPSVEYGFAGFGISAAILFLINLLAAPFRIERGRRIEAEKHAAELASKANRPIWGGEIRNIWFGGESAERGMAESHTNVFLAVTITNTGEPSAVPMWRMLINIAGDIREYSLNHAQKTITLGVEGLGASTFLEADAIYIKTKEPIAKGSYRQGWALAYVPRDYMQKASPGTVVSLVGNDVYGGEFQLDYVIHGRGADHLSFYPDMQQEAKFDANRRPSRTL